VRWRDIDGVVRSTTRHEDHWIRSGLNNPPAREARNGRSARIVASRVAAPSGHGAHGWTDRARRPLRKGPPPHPLRVGVLYDQSRPTSAGRDTRKAVLVTPRRADTRAANSESAPGPGASARSIDESLRHRAINAPSPGLTGRAEHGSPSTDARTRDACASHRGAFSERARAATDTGSELPGAPWHNFRRALERDGAQQMALARGRRAAALAPLGTRPCRDLAIPWLPCSTRASGPRRSASVAEHRAGSGRGRGATTDRTPVKQNTAFGRAASQSYPTLALTPASTETRPSQPSPPKKNRRCATCY
jgi:hypothetical protein